MSNADRCKRYRERRATASPKSSDAPTGLPAAGNSPVAPKISREQSYRCQVCHADVLIGTACKNHAAPVSEYSMASLLCEVKEPTRPKSTFALQSEWDEYHAFVAARTKNLVGDPWNRTADKLAAHNLQHRQWWAEQDRAVAQEHHRQAEAAAAKEKTRLDTLSKIQHLTTGASHL